MQKLALILAAFLAIEGAALAHSLDEYVQATLISLETDRIRSSMRLTPGAAIFPQLLAAIDANSDGRISEVERRQYAERVLSELALSVDGKRLKPQLVSLTFPAIEELRGGTGEIRIEFAAPVPPGGAHRTLVFENQHENRIAAYLVNCLVPDDSHLRVIAQKRSADQSHYELEYAQSET